jgi:hypothetical protein
MSCCTVSPEYRAASRYPDESRSTVTCRRSYAPLARAAVQSLSITTVAALTPAVDGGAGASVEAGAGAAVLGAAVGGALVDATAVAVVDVPTTVESAVWTVVLPELGCVVDEVLDSALVDEVGSTDDWPATVVPDDVLLSLHAAAVSESIARIETSGLADIVPIMEERS